MIRYAFLQDSVRRQTIETLQANDWTLLLAIARQQVILFVPSQRCKGTTYASARDLHNASVPFLRFQGLFHSLSKVLFNVPSRYLSTIGLLLIISLGSSLPPVRNAIPSISTHAFATLRTLVGDCHPLWSPFPRQFTICWCWSPHFRRLGRGL